MNVKTIKERIASMTLHEKLDCLTIYEVRDVEKVIRTFMDLPVNRSLRIEIKNILDASKKMTDEQLALVNSKLEELITVDHLR